MRAAVLLLAAGCETAGSDLLPPAAMDASAGEGDRDARSGSDATGGGGTRDAGTGRDSGPRDAEAPAPEEGLSCYPTNMPQGSCHDPALVCMTWRGDIDTISACVRPCTTDAECASSPTNPICANVGLDIRPDALVPTKACVAVAANEGEVATPNLRHPPLEMSGCVDPLIAYPWGVGSTLFELGDDQFGCGRPCANDAECPSGFCGLDAVDSIPSGICRARRIEKGSLCSLSNITLMCDTTGAPLMTCIDVGLARAHRMDADAMYGHCVEVCDHLHPSCFVQTNPITPPQCIERIFRDRAYGLCDDRCGPFPDSCSAPGLSCTPILGRAHLCIEVSQTEAPFDPFAARQSCELDAHRCPDGTHCRVLPDTSSRCEYGCNTITGTTTCANVGLAECRLMPEIDPDVGVCR